MESLDKQASQSLIPSLDSYNGSVLTKVINEGGPPSLGSLRPLLPPFKNQAPPSNFKCPTHFCKFSCVYKRQLLCIEHARTACSAVRSFTHHSWCHVHWVHAFATCARQNLASFTHAFLLKEIRSMCMLTQDWREDGTSASTVQLFVFVACEVETNTWHWHGGAHCLLLREYRDLTPPNPSGKSYLKHWPVYCNHVSGMLVSMNNCIPESWFQRLQCIHL